MIDLDNKAAEPKIFEQEPGHPLLKFVEFGNDISEMVFKREKCDTMNLGTDDDVYSWAEFHPQAMTRVKLRGEPLGKILWQGTQWAVTDYGFECRDGLYHVAAKDLMKRHESKRAAFNYWYSHIAEKTWCDKEDLDFALQAFMLLYTSKGNRTGLAAGGIELNDVEIEEYASRCASRAYDAAVKRASIGHIKWEDLDCEESDNDAS